MEINKAKYKYEDRFDKINKQFYQKIITELCLYNHYWINQINNLFGEEEEIFNTLHLLVLRENKDIEFFYSLLKKYKYNYFHTLLLLIMDFCNTDYEKTELFLIEEYLKSPFIKRIEKRKQQYQINCILGNITFQKAEQYFKNINNSYLTTLAKTNELAGFCHKSTYEVTKNLPNSFACTSLCNQAFIGQFFHSFTMHNNNCIDLNYNCVIPTSQYLALLNAQIIQKIITTELEKELENFPGNDPILYHALKKLI